jgi:hypothetical protein
MSVSSQITVCIPTSPIPRHPSTDMIEQTIKSIRFHLPESRIIVMCDGVRPNVEFRRRQYEEYLERLVDLYANDMNTDVVIFQTYSQQAKMMRRMLETVTTSYVLFCEHDGELVTNFNPRDEQTETRPEDCQIAWQDISDLLASGGANMVRFYAWDEIHPAHAHLMCGQMIQGASKFIKTTQYSQWPHIATTAFYKKMLAEHFAPDAVKMIEIGMYGPVGMAPWESYRVVIYAPKGNMRRFYHRNGRADETGKQDPVDWA